MKLVRKIAALLGFASTPAGGYVPTRDSVIVSFMYGSTDLSALFELEDRLEEAIAHAGVGELDGNEINVDGSDATLFMYGPSADRLFEVVKPILLSAPFMRNATVARYYVDAPDGAKQSTTVLAP